MHRATACGWPSPVVDIGPSRAPLTVRRPSAPHIRRILLAKRHRCCNTCLILSHVLTANPATCSLCGGSWSRRLFPWPRSLPDHRGFGQATNSTACVQAAATPGPKPCRVPSGHGHLERPTKRRVGRQGLRRIGRRHQEATEWRLMPRQLPAPSADAHLPHRRTAVHVHFWHGLRHRLQGLLLPGGQPAGAEPRLPRPAQPRQRAEPDRAVLRRLGRRHHALAVVFLLDGLHPNQHLPARARPPATGSRSPHGR